MTADEMHDGLAAVLALGFWQRTECTLEPHRVSPSVSLAGVPCQCQICFLSEPHEASLAALRDGRRARRVAELEDWLLERGLPALAARGLKTWIGDPGTWARGVRAQTQRSGAVASV